MKISGSFKIAILMIVSRPQITFTGCDRVRAVALNKKFGYT
ncbi:hypothetical protein [Terrisporobacter petrolearius]|nr:hypothetical protein [Terrisporobacter petrolearius]